MIHREEWWLIKYDVRFKAGRKENGVGFRLQKQGWAANGDAAAGDWAFLSRIGGGDNILKGDFQMNFRADFFES